MASSLDKEPNTNCYDNFSQVAHFWSKSEGLPSVVGDHNPLWHKIGLRAKGLPQDDAKPNFFYDSKSS